VSSANGPNAKEHCSTYAKKADGKSSAAKKRALAQEYAVYGEFEYWVGENDLAAAEKVLKKLTTDEKRAEAINVLANKYVGRGEFKAAMRWADKIKDETCKRQVIEGIATEAYRAMKKRLAAEDLAGAEEILAYIQHPYRRASAIGDLVIQYVATNNFGQAEVWARKIADNEKHQLALYYIAVEGYAARGEMKKAFAMLDTEIVPLFGKNSEDRAVPKRPHILKDMAIVAVENRYGLDEAVARGNAMQALAKIHDIYYRLMAIETMVLYTKSDAEAEALLAAVGYDRDGDSRSENSPIGTQVVVSYSRDARSIIIFVKYGVEEGTGIRPFKVERWLDSEKQKEFDASMKDDEQLKKYSDESKKQEEEQRLAADAEKKLADKYQKFLQDPTDPANQFIAPDPDQAVPQGDHSGHEGHDGHH
ncbi:MAG: hypothetical protein HZA25_03535, partial [Candidatus Niyogibacteria bacterium]|nr:hypothetical protein [Candidatus Niyogibacteria bacterium]